MKKTPSYAWAFVKHPYNQATAIGIAGLSVLASFPMGGFGFALGALSLLAVEIVGIATVPALPNFRAAVDRVEEKRESEATRLRLLEEIDAHGGSSHVRSYTQMCLRVDSLYRTALDSSTTLTENDVAQLDKLTIDYLRMCVSDAVSKGRDGSDLAASVGKRLKAVEQRLATPGVSQDEIQQLKRTRTEYEEVGQRQARMASRQQSLEASLVSMPIRMEEIYQMVMTAPASGDFSALMEESVAKLKMAEEVSIDVEQAFGMKTSGVVSGVRPDAAAIAARQPVAGRE